MMNVHLTEHGVCPSGGLCGRGWTCFPLFSFFSSKRFPSVRRVGCLRNCPTIQFTRCQFYLRSAAFLCFDEGLFRQVIHVLHDGEEDTEVVHLRDELANHADGIQARGEVDAFFSLFLCESVAAMNLRRNLQLAHHEVRLLLPLLTKVADNRRNVMFDLYQQLLGGESWTGVELASEESVIDAFSGV